MGRQDRPLRVKVSTFSMKTRMSRKRRLEREAKRKHYRGKKLIEEQQGTYLCRGMSHSFAQA